MNCSSWRERRCIASRSGTAAVCGVLAIPLLIENRLHKLLAAYVARLPEGLDQGAVANPRRGWWQPKGVMRVPMSTQASVLV